MQSAADIRRAMPSHKSKPTERNDHFIKASVIRSEPEEHHNQYGKDPKQLNRNNPSCLTDQHAVVPCKVSHDEKNIIMSMLRIKHEFA
jgi:hypothetical protein